MDTKLNNLQVKPQTKGDILFFEPLASNANTNYWDWIHTNKNANGIRVDFELQVPLSIQEVRIYNELGDITIDNITSRIYAQTDLGIIKGRNITPLDTAIFKVNLPSKNEKTGIDVSFANLEKANKIISGISLHNISINIPSGTQFTHEIDNNMKVEYDESMYERFKYCKDQCLEDFKLVQPRQGETVIITTAAEDMLKMVQIE